MIPETRAYTRLKPAGLLVLKSFLWVRKGGITIPKILHQIRFQE